jgi:hypothetical protein
MNTERAVPITFIVGGITFYRANAQIAVSTSLMFEAGSQDPKKTLGPLPVA